MVINRLGQSSIFIMEHLLLLSPTWEHGGEKYILFKSEWNLLWRYGSSRCVLVLLQGIVRNQEISNPVGVLENLTTILKQKEFVYYFYIITWGILCPSEATCRILWPILGSPVQKMGNYRRESSGGSKELEEPGVSL